MTPPYFKSESFPPLTFATLGERLRLFVVSKIRNGEFTERGLAANLGISQPHLHHVLKKSRSLRPDFADTLLQYFGVGVLDLVPADELSAQIALYQAQDLQLWLEFKEPDTEPISPRTRKGMKFEEWRRSDLSRLAG